MSPQLPHRSAIEPARSAFTLIEMLVASALVVLMMTIFAQVFQMASGSMSSQRAISENDQQVRTFTTVMRSDLQKRTFRQMVPFFPREDYTVNEASFSNRRGYFYVSENDLNHTGDGVLQFTVDANVISESTDQTPFYGLSSTIPGTSITTTPNQPEADDGQVVANGATVSSAAEVCYFVRNGTLYRRVVLLRQPLPTAGNANSSDVIQPRNQAGAPLFNAATSMPFWANFDHAAIRPPGPTPATQIPYFLGMDNTYNVLDNTLAGATETPLGRSRYRFGFDNSLAPSGATWSGTSGLSREFFGGAGSQFLGRFTHQETSSPGFNYPTLGGPLANPFDSSVVLPDAAGNGVVDLYEGGVRVGQDILLTRVHSFEVELFDARLGNYAKIGHSLSNSAGVPGDFHVGRNLNATYYPTGSTPGHSFDTWHPWYDRDGGGAGDTLPSPTPPSLPNQNYYSSAMLQDNPPYRPMIYDPAPVPIGGLTSAPQPANPSSRPFVWAPNVNYTLGDVVFPPTEDTNYDGVLDQDGQYGFAADGLIDVPTASIPVPVRPYGRAYYYQCINTPTVQSTSYGDQPQWSINTDTVRHAGVGSEFKPQWRPVYNLQPVTSIRLTVRFFHTASQKLRQVTLIHSLKHE